MGHAVQAKWLTVICEYASRDENDTEYNQRYATLGLEDAVLSMGQQVRRGYILDLRLYYL